MRNFLFVMGELADKDIDWLVSAGAPRKLAVGTVIIREGVKIDSIYIVLEGSLEVTVASSPAPVQALMAGEIVGELSFLDTRPPIATVKAKTACTVYAVPREKLRLQLETNAPFAAHFYRALGISLALRFRSLTARTTPGVAVADVSKADELDDDQLERVAFASARFDWLLKKFVSKEVADAGAIRPIPR